MEIEVRDEQLQRNIILTSTTSCAPRLIRIKSWSVISFFKLIDDELDDFLDADQCCRMADNYLIAMVFTYFLRAALRPEEYTKTNFFVALYLAHDMEEDQDDARVMIRDHIGLDEPEVSCSPSLFFTQKDKFWERMHHRGAVSRLCCDKVMQMIRPFHKVWSRRRHVNHSGASRHSNRKDDICPNCPKTVLSQYSTSSSDFSPEVVFSFRRSRLSSHRVLHNRYNFDFE
ncbi:speedy protein A-like isoform X1 [Neodiprion pinetum]|uniref:Speedy protein A-like isoform X1 n=1 Tax=Neodiprion lecontei TaxID=441921 RepID=A0A6J0B9D7_NEOLC|nr:speedy protein A-like isoform X1 [Neodiprion lecontei]XP_046492351.1 speedy protein A-like isoform X1 [Neodiprion pinetum]